MKTKISMMALAAALLFSGCEAYVVDRRPVTRSYGYSSYQHHRDYDGRTYYNDRYYPRSSSTVVIGSRPSVYRSSPYRSGYTTRATNQVYVQPRSSGYYRSGATVVVTDKKKKKDKHHD